MFKELFENHKDFLPKGLKVGDTVEITDQTVSGSDKWTFRAEVVSIDIGKWQSGIWVKTVMKKNTDNSLAGKTIRGITKGGNHTTYYGSDSDAKIKKVK